jgi:hypothetical protein
MPHKGSRKAHDDGQLINGFMRRVDVKIQVQRSSHPFLWWLMVMADSRLLIPVFIQ